LAVLSITLEPVKPSIHQNNISELNSYAAEKKSLYAY